MSSVLAAIAPALTCGPIDEPRAGGDARGVAYRLDARELPNDGDAGSGICSGLSDCMEGCLGIGAFCRCD